MPDRQTYRPVYKALHRPLMYRRTRIGQRVDDNQAAGLTANA